MAIRTIQVRPSREPRWQKQGGWEADEGGGVCAVYCEGNHKAPRDSALDYARQRAAYGRCDIQVLDTNWNLVETIGNEDARPLV